MSRVSNSALAVIGMCLATPHAHAAWTPVGPIARVYSHYGYYFIDISIATNPCGNAGRFYWTTSATDAKDMYAMALMAFAAGKSIAVVYNENSPSCNGGGAAISHMMTTN